MKCSHFQYNFSHFISNANIISLPSFENYQISVKILMIGEALYSRQPAIDLAVVLPPVMLMEACAPVVVSVQV